MKVGIGENEKFYIFRLCYLLPCFPIPYSPIDVLHFLRGILKTVVANYALDKLKIEIAGNSDPALPSSIL